MPFPPQRKEKHQTGRPSQVSHHIGHIVLTAFRQSILPPHLICLQYAQYLGCSKPWNRGLRRGGLGGGQGSLHTGEGLLGPRRPLGTGRGPLNSGPSAAGANSVTGQGGIGARPPIANQKSCQQRPGPRWHSMKIANGGRAAAGMQFFGASWERLGRHFGSSSCWAEGGVHRTGFVECISVLSFYNQKHPH